MLLGFDQMTAKENGKFFYNTYLSRIFFTLRKDSDLPEEKKKKKLGHQQEKMNTFKIQQAFCH